MAGGQDGAEGLGSSERGMGSVCNYEWGHLGRSRCKQTYGWLSIHRFNHPGSFTMFTVCSCLNPRMWNLQIQRANCKTCTSVEFGIRGSSRTNLVDTRCRLSELISRPSRARHQETYHICSCRSPEPRISEARGGLHRWEGVGPRVHLA